MSDIVFPHTDAYEIPLLDLTKQGQFVELPVAGWGSVSRRGRFRGTWHFYVDDSKFSALWKHPETVLNTKAVYCVEPNFSTHQQMQMPVALHRIYQKRWLARYWQEQGMGIFADLFVSPKWAKINMHGIPRGWQSYATHAADARIDDLDEQVKRAQDHATGLPLRMLVYGGGQTVATYCQKHDLIHIRDARNESRDG